MTNDLHSWMNKDQLIIQKITSLNPNKGAECLWKMSTEYSLHTCFKIMVEILKWTYEKHHAVVQTDSGSAPRLFICVDLEIKPVSWTLHSLGPYLPFNSLMVFIFTLVKHSWWCSQHLAFRVRIMWEESFLVCSVIEQRGGWAENRVMSLNYPVVCSCVIQFFGFSSSCVNVQLCVSFRLQKLWDFFLWLHSPHK